MLSCIITSANETVRYDKVRSITVPAISGSVQILSGHAEAFIVLTKGNITLSMSQRPREVMGIIRGECHVRDNIVVIIL